MVDIDINKQPMKDEVCLGSDDDECSVEHVGLSTDDEEEKVSEYDIDDLMCDEDEGGNTGVNVSICEETVIGAIGGNCKLERLLDEKSAQDLSEDDVIGLEFPTIEATEIFYQKYSLFIGFGVRRDDKRYDADGVVIKRRWVCCRARLRPKKKNENKPRKRKRRPISRVKCPAEIQVKLCREKGKYVVNRFNCNHSHQLVSPHQLHLVRSNRKVCASALATAIALRRVGVSTRKIMDLMVSECGGFDKVGFSKVDLQNALGEHDSQQIEVSDAQTCFAYLRAKGRADKGMYVRYSVDEERRLCNLFWADSLSRFDYQCWGEVVGFDATYNRNKYRKPIVMIIGSNGHWRTVVFGIVILEKETVHTYKWLLETFLECINQVKPVTVITDGDKAMRAAVRDLMPNCYHRLYAWHLARNAEKYVKTRNFNSALMGLMYGDFSVEEFENRWVAVVESMRLQNNRWVQGIYRLRHMWVAAYIKGTFFASMRTTQRCESLNAILTEHLKRKFKLYKFVEEMDVVQARIRNNELSDDYTSRHTDLELASHLKVIEKSVAALFLRPIFFMVRDEIVEEQCMVAEKRLVLGETDIFEVRKFLNEEKEWVVSFRRSDNYVKCSCMIFESEGIPCSHSFVVLKAKHVSVIPPSLVNRRWTKDAKPSQQFERFTNATGNMKVKELSMYGTLSVAASRACLIGSKDRRAFDTLMTFFNNFCGTFALPTDTPNVPEGKSNGKALHEEVDNVCDPAEATTKGAPKKSQSTPKRKNKCGNCKRYGHNARKCMVNRKLGPTKQSQMKGKGKGKKPTPGIGQEDPNCDHDELRYESDQIADLSA